MRVLCNHITSTQSCRFRSFLIIRMWGRKENATVFFSHQREFFSDCSRKWHKAQRNEWIALCSWSTENWIDFPQTSLQKHTCQLTVKWKNICTWKSCLSWTALTKWKEKGETKTLSAPSAWCLTSRGHCNSYPPCWLLQCHVSLLH